MTTITDEQVEAAAKALVAHNWPHASERERAAWSRKIWSDWLARAHAALTADIDRWHELSEARLRAIDDYRSQIATLTKELAEARDQQISAVNGMLQAEVELAEADKVIEPFANSVGLYEGVSDTYQVGYHNIVGHLRAASAFVNRNKIKTIV